MPAFGNPAFGILGYSLAFDTGYGIVTRDPAGPVASILATATGWSVTGTMAVSGAMTFANGTAAAPSIAFTNSTGLGFYRNADNVLGLAVGGVAGLAIAGSIPTIAAATDTAGQNIFIKAADAGGTATTAKTGAAVALACGAGSASTGAFAGGAGGAFSTAGGVGGANTGGASGEAGGAGGANTKTGGNGGATNSTGAHTGGVGGVSTQAGGTGGAQTGAAQAGGAGGASGSTGGTGGASTLGTGGAGGASNCSGGVGGAGVTGGIGGATTIVGGAGGAGGTTGGVGGAVTITGGAAGTGGNVNGGSVTIAGGLATGTGTRGNVAITGLRTTSTTPTAITGATSLVLADSGGIFTVAQSSAYAVTLPTPAGAGQRYILQLVSPGAFDVTVAATACTFEGTIVNDTTSVLPATGSTFTFATGTAVLGDNIEFISTSTSKYFARAVSSAAGGITIA